MRILIIEDDPRLAESVEAYLRGAGFAVDVAMDGRRGLYLAAVNAYDAVVLDLQLPDVDGLDVCRRLHEGRHPPRIIAATARAAIDDRIRGLDEGADDYLVKPYALGELVARLRALLRRPQETLGTQLVVGDLVLDLATRVARRGRRSIELTTKEFAVLETLMRRPGDVLTREHINSRAWDDNHDPMSNVIDVYIGRLRRKIDAAGEEPMVHTVRGAGYRIGEPVAAPARGSRGA